MNDLAKQSYERRLVHGARFRYFPINVKCPVRCAFCYEARISDLFDWIETVTIPPYNDSRFAKFEAVHAEALKWEAQTGRDPLIASLPPFDVFEDGMAYHPTCDTFLSGLSETQIEKMVQLRVGDKCMLHTVGLNVKPDFIARLTKKYLDTLWMHISIITFDAAIRKQVMPTGIKIECIEELCRVSRSATLFLIHFTSNQLCTDIERLCELTEPNQGQIYIHKLYTNRLSPKRQLKLAAIAEQQLEATIARLAQSNLCGRQLMLNPGGAIQAYTRRNELYKLFDDCTGLDNEVVFCSPGAFDVIESFFSEVPNKVVAMPSAFGGNIDFLQGCRVRSVLEYIKEQRAAGKKIEHVVLPQAMFWIGEGCDIGGERPELLTENLFDLTVTLLPVPQEMICSAVNLEDCIRYFHDHPGGSAQI